MQMFAHYIECRRCITENTTMSECGEGCVEWGVHCNSVPDCRQCGGRCRWSVGMQGD